MYTFEELRRAAELLVKAGEAVNKADPSGYGSFSLCAYEGELFVFPTTAIPRPAIEIIRLTKLDVELGPGSNTWDKVFRGLRVFIKEGILK